MKEPSKETLHVNGRKRRRKNYRVRGGGEGGEGGGGDEGRAIYKLSN